MNFFDWIKLIDCSFCWYWWKSWASLFRLPFHNIIIYQLFGHFYLWSHRVILPLSRKWLILKIICQYDITSNTNMMSKHIMTLGPSCLWLYGCWIYNYLCNQCLSSLTLWVRTLLMRDQLDTTLCDKVCLWLAAGQWFSLGILVSSTNITDCYNLTEMMLKMALNTTNLT